VLGPKSLLVTLETVSQPEPGSARDSATTARSHADLLALLIRTFANSLLMAAGLDSGRAAPG
jgi:hypothetical protein